MKWGDRKGGGGVSAVPDDPPNYRWLSLRNAYTCFETFVHAPDRHLATHAGQIYVNFNEPSDGASAGAAAAISLSVVFALAAALLA